MYHRIKLKAVHRKDMDLSCEDTERTVPTNNSTAAAAPAHVEVTGVADENIDAILRGSILRCGKVPINLLARELCISTFLVQQACLRLCECGFLKRKPGLGVRYELDDAGAEVCEQATMLGQQDSATLDPAHFDAMVLLDRLHAKRFKYITTREVTEKHNIEDKAVAAATLIWLEKQGSLKRCKASIKGREVLKTKAAKATLVAFRSILVAAGAILAGDGDAEDQGQGSSDAMQDMIQKAAARHKAQVAAMYESAAAARQIADETPHTIGGGNPTNHSANRLRTYAGVHKQQTAVSPTTVVNLEANECGQLRANGSLPAQRGGVRRAQAPSDTGATPAAAMSPLNITEGINTPGLSEKLPTATSKRSRVGGVGQSCTVTAQANVDGTASPPESVSKTLTRTGCNGKRPRTSTISMAVQQQQPIVVPGGNGGRRTRAKRSATAVDEFSFTD
jgi:hypothetical protein